jgi:hypothetical protein
MIKTDRIQERNSRTRKEQLRLLAFVFVFSIIIVSFSPVRAQTTSLRNPLIPSASQTAPGQKAPIGQAPPIGDGNVPEPIPAGMGGPPTLLPWKTNVPANQIDIQDSQVNLGVDPSVETPPFVLGPMLNPPHPPSTPGGDPGMLPGHPGFAAPARIVNINPNGGMPGDLAPTTKWGGQTARDFGLYRTHGSQLNDFGQRLKDKPDLAVKPVPCEDGPRPATYPGQMGADSNRDPNIAQNSPGQTTQDLYGNRMLIQGRLRALMTIAPY